MKLYCFYNKESENSECVHARVQLAISTLFSLGSPAQGIILLTINKGLLTSINPPKTCLEAHHLFPDDSRVCQVNS